MQSNICIIVNLYLLIYWSAHGEGIVSVSGYEYGCSSFIAMVDNLGFSDVASPHFEAPL